MVGERPSGFNGVITVPFPGAPEHSPARLYALRLGRIEVLVTNEGASIFRILTPDAQGVVDDIVCYSPRHNQFAANAPYLGATVGRYANRILHAGFELNGQYINLVANAAPHHLHGGESWHRDCWTTDIPNADTWPEIRFHRTSPAGEGGYPGTVRATVTYRLTEQGELHIEYHATTDAPTVVNLTNHAYFNLNGAFPQDLSHQWFIIHAQERTATDDEGLPTGAFAPVADSVFDLSKPTRVKDLLTPMHPDLVATNGFDQNYVFKRTNSPELITMATVVSRQTGRVLQIASTQPGMQFYTGNYLGGTPSMDDEQPYAAHQAFCCEPQHFPDTPNQPDFPPCTVTPDQPYHERIVYRFGAKAIETDSDVPTSGK